MPVPGLGYLSGRLNLNDKIAPKVPEGTPRPFAPGENLINPDGTWSSEMSYTLPHPTEAGKFTVIPGLWLDNNKPVRVREDTALEYAKRSGLVWPTWNTQNEADAASMEREKNWQSIRPEDAGSVSPLWSLLK